MGKSIFKVGDKVKVKAAHQKYELTFLCDESTNALSYGEVHMSYRINYRRYYKKVYLGGE